MSEEEPRQINKNYIYPFDKTIYGELENIMLIPGMNIPYHKNDRVNYQFNHMEFKDMETYDFSHNPEESDTGKKKLLDVMKDKQRLLWIRSIGDIGGLTSDKENESSIMSATDAEKYAKLPCCFQTPYGTLVPQVIVPTRNVIDNGLVFIDANSEEAQTGASQEEGSGTTNKGMEQAKKEGGYNWYPVKIDAKNFSGRNQAMLQKCIESPLTYGVRSSIYKCVSNENNVNQVIDTPIYAEREYKCDTSQGICGSGSCAICYKIVMNNEIGDGDTKKQKELAPLIRIQLAGKMNSKGVSKEVNTIGATIAKSGQMIGVVGEHVGQGSLPEPSNEIMPPHCVKTGDTYDLQPIFMYPLYNGFIMTNSVISNLKEGNNGLFIKYDDVPLNPIYTARIRGVELSEEMKEMQEHDNVSELMKWFPTIYQETAPGTRDNIKIRVPRSERINFADTISLKFYKSLGRFAYCPIFFHRKIKFTLYFKGEYKNPDPALDNSSNWVYRFYPLVCANIGENIADEWSGLSNDGSDCVSDVRFVTSDDKLQESIYAVDFEFSSSSFQRYPIEIFGAVAVFERHNFQFPVDGSNGSFEFERHAISMFTGLVEEQNKFGLDLLYPIGNPNPDTQDTNFWGGTFKFFPLINSVSISASMDGISGSMSIDGYPLSQGIKVFKQEQTIGEIDLAVMQNGVSHYLFSGYGMELATNNSENSYNIGVNLYGINKKLEDMRLICCPFWDGDRLEMISSYFEEYAKIQIRMIDHTVTRYEDAKYVNLEQYTNGESENDSYWASNSKTIVNSVGIRHPTFRVPRSCDWRSPAVTFPVNEVVMNALKQLGQLTGCICIPQLDGNIVFYELNNLGFPYYVDNQEDIVVFRPTDIISISMQPQLQNKYNAIATFGLLQRKNPEGKVLAEENVKFGSYFNKTNDGQMPNVGVQYPWTRQSVGVESAMLTNLELAAIHQNRIKMMTADIYIGNLTVKGNTSVNHIYQKISVAGHEYFVLSIEHSLDFSSKVWTTSYQIQCINRDGNSDENINNLNPQEYL